MSSVVKGAPSDHLTPSIRCMVSLVPSSDHSQLLARRGIGLTSFVRNMAPVLIGSSWTMASMPNQPCTAPAS